MAKNKFKNNIQQAQSSTHAGSQKSISPLLQRFIPTAEQTAKSIDVVSPEWNVQTLELLREAISSDRREEFDRFLQQFIDLGNATQAALKSAEEAEKQSSASAQAFDEKQDELTAKETKLGGLQKDLELREKKVLSDEAALIDRLKSLETREANARANFASENATALENLRLEITKLEGQRIEIHNELSTKRRVATENIATEVSIAQKDIEQKQIALDELHANLNAQKQAQDYQQRRIDRDQRSTEQLETMLKKQLESEQLASLRKKDGEIEKLRGVNERLAAEIDEVRGKISSYVALEQELKGKSARALMDEVSELQRSCQEKDREIQSIKFEKGAVDVVALKKENEYLVEKLRTLMPDYEELKRKAFQFNLGVMEKEQWATERRLLAKKNELMSAHLNDLESRITSLTEAEGKQSSFPELHRFDSENSFNTPVATVPVANLKTFTGILQHRIAASQPGNPLYFRLEDLQLFVGGLAMSQLHILQGISGTGKTSLAKAFAKAVGGECTDIAVQAGWRDRADLLGHYNAFEKRFYEKDCLQALYKAQTPSLSDRVNIVLLDEMNLSRPEQYFADFLSGLEKAPGDRLVPLMESAPANAPKLLRDGREILIPENVWFIGTANQDETTNEFADKTHDRAFIMELPRHEGSFEFNGNFEDLSYQFNSLKSEFRKAQKKDEAEVRELLKFIAKSELTKVYEDRFDRGWGNRFERQALKFMPVVRAAGGSFETAIDHMLSTRVFRAGKVTGRYDTKKEDLIAIEKALLSTLRKILPNIVPIRCQLAIETEIKRLEKS
jgi:hypothetical protein